MPDDHLLLEAHALPVHFSHRGDPLPADQVIFQPPAASSDGSPGPAVVSREQFEHNWRVFTMGQLDGLDWRNVFAAGGAVLACATVSPPTAAPNQALIQKLLSHAGTVDPALSGSPVFLAFHGPNAPGDLARSDIDLFLHSLQSPEEAATKVKAIYETLRRNAEKRGSAVYAARTQKTMCALLMLKILDI